VLTAAFVPLVSLPEFGKRTPAAIMKKLGGAASPDIVTYAQTARK